MNKIKNINLLFFFIYYSIFGFIINIIFKGKFFEFLYENGFEVILKYIFVGNTTWLLKHVRMADENFYYLYFSFFIFIIGIYFLINLRKIIFSRNFHILYLKMKNNGFDKQFFVPVNKKGCVLNGAHRVAISQLLNYWGECKL